MLLLLIDNAPIFLKSASISLDHLKLYKYVNISFSATYYRYKREMKINSEKKGKHWWLII